MKRRALKKRYGHARSWAASPGGKRELVEMKEILVKRGFSPHHAKALQAEGMGSEELRSRAAIPPREVGGLTYTHRIKKAGA